jgi:hypothetical protein
VADVIAAVDGPIALTACVEASVVECESQGLCPMRGRWDPVNEAIQQALAAITLADMQEASIPRAFRLPARTQGPMTQGPIAQGSITQGPITQEPITPSPITQGPVAQRPISAAE